MQLYSHEADYSSTKHFSTYKNTNRTTLSLLCEWHDRPLTAGADALEVVEANTVHSQTFTEELKEGKHLCSQW